MNKKLIVVLVVLTTLFVGVLAITHVKSENEMLKEKLNIIEESLDENYSYYETRIQTLEEQIDLQEDQMRTLKEKVSK